MIFKKLPWKVKYFLIPFTLSVFASWALVGCRHEIPLGSEPTGSILWAPGSSAFSLPSWSLRREGGLDPRYFSSQTPEGDILIRGLAPGWYSLTAKTTPPSRSPWIQVYPGWEAALVWKPGQADSLDLPTTKSAMHSQNPEWLRRSPVGLSLLGPQSDNALKSLIPLELDGQTMVLALNNPGPVMGKGGLSSDWNQGSPFYRKESRSPWVYLAQGDPAGFLEYQLLTVKNPGMLDPVNPFRKNIDDLGKGNGWLSWPQNPARILLSPEDGNTPAGALEEFVLPGRVPGYSKRVRVYTPPDYNPRGEPYKSVYFHDGQMHLAYGLTRCFDQWIREKKVPPFVAIFVDNDPEYRRSEFLTPKEVPEGWGVDPQLQKKIAQGALPTWYAELSELYLDLWSTKLIPEVSRRYNLSTSPQDRAVHGASNGAIITLILLGRYPQLFGNAAAVSLYAPDLKMDRYGEIPLKLYFSYGRYERPANYTRFSEGQLSFALKDKALVTLLTGPFPGTHDPVSWASDLPRLMEFWWGTSEDHLPDR